ncbi:MAG TPA: Rnf-Nqr domain containing protein [Pseudoflavonifractor sp.]|nr:Rnf-Nqr domain containing protein [Pseudoflavonifractor sp.]
MKKEKSKAWLELRQNAPGMARAGLKNAGRWLRERFALEPERALAAFRTGLTRRALMLSFTLVLCAALPATASLRAGLGMGLASAAVLLLVNFIVALLPERVPRRVRAVVYAVLAAILTAAASLFLQTRFPTAAEGVGGALTLVAVNCLLLIRTGDFMETLIPSYAALDGLSAGLGLTLALAALGAVREVLGAGTLWGRPILDQPALLLAAPCGGLLLLGVCAAGARWLRGKLERKGRQV